MESSFLAFVHIFRFGKFFWFYLFKGCMILLEFLFIFLLVGLVIELLYLF